MIRAVIFDMYETLITHYASPLYFGAQMAQDAGMDKDKFQKPWEDTEDDRTLGKVTLEEVLEKIFKENGCYSESKIKYIANKRTQCKEESFRHLHPEIVPMLCSLKEKGIMIGLISNCFSEEAAVIKKSILYPYFDAVCLSYDEKMKKPDKAIFHRCLEKLNLQPEECLYAGDGGSHELEAATTVGMKAVQAVYKALGCVHAEEINTKLAEEEPCDVQMKSFWPEYEDDIPYMGFKDDERAKWNEGEIENINLVPKAYVGDPAGYKFIRSNMDKVYESFAKSVYRVFYGE